MPFEWFSRCVIIIVYVLIKLLLIHSFHICVSRQIPSESAVGALYPSFLPGGISTRHYDDFSLCWLLYGRKQLAARVGVQFFKSADLEELETFIAVNPAYQRQSIERYVIPVVEQWSVDTLDTKIMYENIISSSFSLPIQIPNVSANELQ